MGAGKTTYGKKLARHLNFDFIDLDTYIVNKTGKSINQIFKKEGEKYFRNLETENLRLLRETNNIIISVGGGAPCFHDNMNWMNENGITIYLKLDSASIYSRLSKAKAERPLIAEKSKSEILEYIKNTLKERGAFYEQANIVIDSKDLSTKKFAEIIKDYLSSI